MITARIVARMIPTTRSPRKPRARRTIVTIEPEDGDEDRPGREAAEGDGRALAADDDPCLVEPDEGDEEPDADRDRLLQVERDRVEDLLPPAGEDEGRDGDALQHDQAHGGRERQPLADDEAEGDDGVDPEPGRDRVGHVRVQAHRDRHHAGDEAGDGEDLVERQSERREVGNPREAQDLRVHEDDVRHHDEGRDAGHRVARERGAVLGEAEMALEERCPQRPGHLGHELPSPSVGTMEP